MGLLKRLFASDQLRTDERIRTGLLEDYNAELRLAKQLRAHADEAPYRHASERLVQLAELAESQADQLRGWIHRYGGTVPPVSTTPAGGHNHWARLVRDLDEVRAAARRYLEQAIFAEDVDRELGQALRTLEREEQQHRVWIQDQIARADPHALN